MRRTQNGWYHAVKSHTDTIDNLVRMGIYRTIEAWANERTSKKWINGRLEEIKPGMAILGLREMGKYFSLSTSVISNHVKALEGLDLIKTQIHRNKGCIVGGGDLEPGHFHRFNADRCTTNNAFNAARLCHG